MVQADTQSSTPLELDTQEVLNFVVASLPAAPASVLEIGAGDGQLACLLQARGWRVKAVDRHAEVVEAARARGVDAVCADVLAFESDPFDAVLCTRSFHHVFPLEAATRKVHALTKPGGVLILDEFALDEVDLQTAAWFCDVWALLDEAGVLPNEPARRHCHGHGHAHDAGADASEPSSPLERWRAGHHHDPPLHGGKAMLDALGGAFASCQVSRVASLYRRFAERLEQDARGARLFLRIRELEEARIAEALIQAFGLRIVCRRPA